MNPDQMDGGGSVAARSINSKSSVRSHGSSRRGGRSTRDASMLRRTRGSSKESTASRSRTSRYSAMTKGSSSTANLPSVARRDALSVTDESSYTETATYEGNATAPTYAMESLASGTYSSPTEGQSSVASSPQVKILGDEYYKAMEEKLKHEEILQSKKKHSRSPSMSSTASSIVTTSSSSCRAGQLPWFEDDNETLREQVAFWKNYLIDGGDTSIAHEEVKDLLKALYTVLRSERIHRSDRTLEEVSQRLSKLKRLDLQKLADCMIEHQKAAEAMDGEDVVLLTGAVGSGKTTTLHFLAGSKFEEAEVDGFIHLEPIEIADPNLKNCKTACGRDAITRSMQITEVECMGKKLVICDTPGFGLDATPEEELAFYYGMRKALDKASRVKPVVVLNAELMGACFSNLPETLQMMQQDLCIKTPRDLRAFEYVFTHYEERHRTRLCQQFASLKKNKPPRPEKGGRELFDDFVNDIIQKTSPRAKLVMPLDESPQELLAGLWREVFVEEPKNYYYRTPVKEKVLKQLQLQLQITVEELRVALSREVYSVALNRMVLLDKLSQWFPQAKQAALMAKEAASRQVAVIWKWMQEEIRTANFSRALFRMEQMSDFGLIFPDAHECFKRGHDLIWESLVTPMEESNYKLAMERIMKLTQLANQYSEASQCVKRALRLLRKKTESILDVGGYEEAVSLLFLLHDLQEIPDAKECANHIIRNLRELMELSFSKEDFSTGARVITNFLSLKNLYPQVEEIIIQGLTVCPKSMERFILQGDCALIWSFVQRLQKFQAERPQAEEVVHFAMNLFSRTLNHLMNEEEHDQAINIIRAIAGEAARENPEWMLDMRKRGIRAYGEKIQALIREDRDYFKAMALMKEGDLNTKSKECTSIGLAVFSEELKTVIKDQKDYSSGVSLMKEVDTQVGSKHCSNEGLAVFSEEVQSLVREDKDYDAAFSLLHTMKENVPGSNVCTLKSLDAFGAESKHLVVSKKYHASISLMRQLNQEIPESLDCIANWLSLFSNEVAFLVQSKEYRRAVDLIRELLVDFAGGQDFLVEWLTILNREIESLAESSEYRKATDLMIVIATNIPGSKNCIENALIGFSKDFELLVGSGNYNKALELMKELATSFPGCTGPVEDWLRLFDKEIEQLAGYGDHIKALTLMKELTRSFPGAKSCMEEWLKLYGKEIEFLFESGEYRKVTTLMRELITNFPEANNCIERGLKHFEKVILSLVGSGEHSTAIALTKELITHFPTEDDSIANWLNLYDKEIHSLVGLGQYNHAIAAMKGLTTTFPEANDCLESWLRLLGKEFESLVNSKDYNKSVLLMKDLATEIPGTDEYVLKGLLALKGGLREAINDGDYETAINVINEVNTLAKIVPQADACIEHAFNSLEENILMSIDRQEYKNAIHLMELLSEGENRLPLAKECTHVGIQVLKRNVAKAIEKKKFSPAMDMIQQLSDKAGKIPEVGECSRRGLELLKTTAVKAIEDRDYATAIEIITNLGELSHLPEGKSCTLAALHAIVNHVTELRNTVEKTVEEVGKIKDLKVFVAMLLKLKAEVEKVMKTEPLRKLSVQIHYKKNFRTKEEESGDNNVLFVPQLYTSQAFCSDHIELLASNVREKLPDFDVNDACMESLIRNRKAILSVMIRLKATNKILISCPGGEKVSAIYESTFKQFHALVDTVLAIAEESFKPPIDMRLFELQAWFLSVLIKGFIKDKIDVDSDERKRMEELESRRRVLMLQFEVQMTDAIELLTDQEFVNDLALNASDSSSAASPPSVSTARADEGAPGDAVNSVTETAIVPVEGPHQEITKEHNTVTAEAIEMLDFTVFETPRKNLLSLCQRPELFNMVLKQTTSEQVRAAVRKFDKSLVKYLGQMVKFGDKEYNGLIEYAKKEASMPLILEKVRKLKVLVDKMEVHLGITRSWGPEFITGTSLHQQKLLILKKRIELATEKLQTAIETEKEIGFGAFVSNIATAPFFCSGKWYEDVPTSFL